jgi:exodeoxyribonuclease V gamma subunit
MLTIHRSERADALVDALVEVVAAPLSDPFAAEVVAVPTRGVERWLTHRLGAAIGTSPGRHDGVCANVEFPFPGRLVSDVLAVATGVDRDEDPWRPERLVWPVLTVLDRCAGEPWLRMVGAHLGVRGPGEASDDDDALRHRRRHPAARHIAELFDRYGVFRPSIVLSWLDRTEADDAADSDLPPDARWQPELLRRVRRQLGVPSPPERIAEACDRLRAGEVEVDGVLPERVSLFGLTRLPATYLEVLRSLATHRDVHLFALHPSLTLWDRIDASHGDLVARVAAGLPRADDPTRRQPRHPLLATWAHDSREMQLVLSAAAEAEVAHRSPSSPRRRGSLLARLQESIRDDVPLPGSGTPLPRLDAGDRSVQVHACHGRGRQVEVLRDAICHLLAADPTLEPRDVIVLCPDIDEYAPLLHSTFGARDPDDPDPPPGPPVLPYRLADRSLRQTNPLLGALADLLDLLDDRLTATEVLRFAGRPPVRRRFAFDDDALERIAGWVEDSGVRWGLDAEHRRPWSLHTVTDHTWRAGLDRVLLGVAMDADDARTLGGRLPLDDVDSGDIDLAGRLAELVDRLGTIVAHCCEDRPVADWVALLGRATDLLLAAPPSDAWQRVQLDLLLREVLAESSSSGTPNDRPLSLAEVRSLLGTRLAGMPTRADFRTGAITMCTLVPMRAVPHRVVCILGLDDGVFPRASRTDGDDLLQRVPLVGDRDPRTEDRQLLLDALLAAEETVVLTYTGHDERTNEQRAPSVPLIELLDVLDRTAAAHDGTPAGQAARTHHPLQPFDPDAFDDDAPWSFDPVQLAGARSVVAERVPPPPFLPTALSPREETTVGLDELVRFVQDPLRELLRQRFGLSTWDDDDQLSDAIPIELDGLQRWAVGQRILRQLLAGTDLDAAVRAEIAGGTLPPGELRHQLLRDVANAAGAIHRLAVDEDVSGAPTSVEVDVDADLVESGGGRVRVLGTVPGVRGDTVAEVSFSSLSPKTRLALWVRLLAVSAARPDREWQTVGIGKARHGGKLVRHRALDRPAEQRATDAARLLGRLVALRQHGLCEPLPLPCKTAEAWASTARREQDPSQAAAQCWSGGRYDGDADDPSVVRIYGEGFTFDQLMSLRPGAHEHGPGWTDEPSRLGRLARHVWDPILVREAWR